MDTVGRSVPRTPGWLRILQAALRRPRKLIILLSDPVYRSALRVRVAATTEHEEVNFLHSFRTVVDVGAHRGQFAAFSAKHFPKAHLICFEPLTGCHQALREVVRSSRAATVFPLALGSTKSRAVLHISNSADSSSLLPISDRQSSLFPGTHEVGTQNVQVERMDDVLAPVELVRPTLLKIDVQGAELDVLEGGEQTLRAIDEILVEGSFQELYAGQDLVADVICFLRARGFSLVGISSVCREAGGACIQADFHFCATETR